MIYLHLFIIFLKVGIIGFGGGYAILPLIYQDVQEFGIMTADDFSNLVALSQVTPGPIAINAATYVGYRAGGLLGAFVATTAVTLPAYTLIMIALMFLKRFKENRIVKAILYGIKPATVGLMASAFIFMAQTALLIDSECELSDIKNNISFVGVVIFIITLILIRYSKLGAISITIIGGILGIVLSII
ncbi:MAG: chromate transporter [Marinilabiliaceae bacterium]|nr:chromate transporter [Marinilabiliaceae bacterium]